MKKVILFISLFSALLCTSSYAQDTILLDQDYGATPVRTCSAIFYDSGGKNGKYTTNEDHRITFAPSVDFLRSTDSFYYRITFLDLDIHPSDSLFITEGQSQIPVIGLGKQVSYNWYNDENFIPEGRIYHVGQFSKDNFSEFQITFRFKSSTSFPIYNGWKIKIECIPYCQKVNVAIDDHFYKLVNGTRVSFPVKESWEDITENGVSERFYYKMIDLCQHDTVILKAKGIYPDNSKNGYEQSDATSTFYWNFRNGNVLETVGSNELQKIFSKAAGSVFSLKIKDLLGCESSATSNIRIRVAGNPIVGVGTIPNLYNHETISLSIGNTPESVIKTNVKEIATASTKQYDSLTFIPDRGCISFGNASCVKLPIYISGYLTTKKITSSKEIETVCTNIEHSASQNLSISLICPTGQKAVMLTTGIDVGNVNSLGYRSRHGVQGRRGENPWNKCLVNDTSNQPCKTPGTYCWSEYYTTNSLGYMDSQQKFGSLKIPETDMVNKTGYYKPGSNSMRETFNNLIGCPYNGEWILEICDNYYAHNGWLYSWQLDFVDKTSNQWEYTANLDTVLWDNAFELSKDNPNTAIFTSDSAGTFQYPVSVVDSFACSWNTNLNIKVLQNGFFIFESFPDTMDLNKTVNFSITPNLGDRPGQEIKLRIQIPVEYSNLFDLAYKSNPTDLDWHLLFFDEGSAYIYISHNEENPSFEALSFQLSILKESIQRSASLLSKSGIDRIPVSFTIVSADNISTTLSPVYEKEILLRKETSVERKETLDNEEIKIYPNPVKKGEELSLELPFSSNDLQGSVLEIVNVNGRVVWSTNPKTSNFRLKMDFEKGTYLLRLRKNGELLSNIKVLVK